MNLMEIIRPLPCKCITLGADQSSRGYFVWLYYELKRHPNLPRSWERCVASKKRLRGRLTPSLKAATSFCQLLLALYYSLFQLVTSAQAVTRSSF